MSKRDSILLLQDMLEAAQKILLYNAVVRNFEIIGEAANRIDQKFRNTHAEIEWNRIRGFRNRIVHDYFGIDHRIVWTIIESYLDDLIKAVGTIIEEISDGQDSKS